MKFVEFSTNSYTEDRGFWVSDESYDLVKQYKWHVAEDSLKHGKNHSPHYVIMRRATAQERKEGWACKISISRFVLGFKKNNNQFVDHKNGWLDNQIESLRPATNQNNQRYSKAQNRKKTANFGLPKGVGRVVSKTRPFVARITIDGVNKHLGRFATPELAHEAYCKAALQYFGEYAKFN